jgi:hypothetical protein
MSDMPEHRDVPYYKPHREGPLFPEDGRGIGDEFEVFLGANDRDVSDEVARKNTQDMADDSFRTWAQPIIDRKLKEMGLDSDPKDGPE